MKFKTINNVSEETEPENDYSYIVNTTEQLIGEEEITEAIQVTLTEFAVSKHRNNGNCNSVR